MQQLAGPGLAFVRLPISIVMLFFTVFIKPGQSIRINFLRIRIRIWIQLLKMCNKLPYEEFSGVEIKRKRLLKVKKTMKLVQIYLIL